MSEKKKSPAREKLDKMPLIETHINKSKDGKWIIHKTILTDIKPVSYYEKVFEEKDFEVEDVLE